MDSAIERLAARELERADRHLPLLADGAMRAVAAIEGDLCDRKALQSHWNMIDPGVKAEIREIWTEIVSQAFNVPREQRARPVRYGVARETPTMNFVCCVRPNEFWTTDKDVALACLNELRDRFGSSENQYFLVERAR